MRWTFKVILFYDKSNMSLQNCHYCSSALKTEWKTMGTRETGGKETGGKAMGAKEMRGKTIEVREMGGKETGGKASGVKATV